MFFFSTPDCVCSSEQRKLEVELASLKAKLEKERESQKVQLLVKLGDDLSSMAVGCAFLPIQQCKKGLFSYFRVFRVGGDDTIRTE